MIHFLSLGPIMQKARNQGGDVESGNAITTPPLTLFAVNSEAYLVIPF